MDAIKSVLEHHPELGERIERQYRLMQTIYWTRSIPTEMGAGGPTDRLAQDLMQAAHEYATDIKARPFLS